MSAQFRLRLPREGNTTVNFDILSYAGVFTITAIVDADHVPDPDDVIRRLRNELDLIMAAPHDCGQAR